ncbi:hypothetical protein HPC38_02930 [Pasteurellaceae bacterium HPA106]|uniref:CDP-glycerol glycerophosphotransferase family protein n=1 Tax=Spirabiliibacterium pneumoniae TaxID=221400 RepID=UPI001AAD3389|nr:CDP-glycerol glycerophosphotransferase family protein [Spirabiliibacterium pneumoniae]MBE2895834.1 hypothetical protein [Spirabiliibacterium pneumoniae]
MIIFKLNLKFYKKYIKKLILTGLSKVIGLISQLVPKDKNLVLSFVDFEKINDELIPYKNDGVYIFSEYLKKEKSHLKIVYLSSNQFGGLVRNKNIVTKIKNIIFRIRSSIIIYKQPPHITSYFSNNQNIICLGYFLMPFKSDYWELKKWWYFYGDYVNENYDENKFANDNTLKKFIIDFFTYQKKQFRNKKIYYITASEYASDLISRSHNIPRHIFCSLGSVKAELSKRQVNVVDLFKLNTKPACVVLYTPTFRDKYFYKNNQNLKDDVNYIFENNDREILSDFLVKENIILIIKFHKSFNYYRKLENKLKREDNSYCDNCYFLTFEHEKQFNISINDLFNSSDAMITDYSSISFDYLSYNKPIIYYMPDFDEYREYRGFSHEPITDMIAGDTTFNLEQLISSLKRIVSGADEWQEKRSLLLNRVNPHFKEDVNKNILEFMVNKKII